MAVCTDCGDQGAECLTAERVRVCTSCLYERTARERDELRELLADTLAALTGATTRAPSYEHLAQLPGVAREMREELARIHRLAPVGTYTVSAPHEEEILRLRDALRRAHAERDEARELLAKVFDRYACAACSHGKTAPDCPCGFHAAGAYLDRTEAK